jgi:formate dehydrogenase subunit delta
MSDGELATLIRMANQIATAFEGQRGDAAADAAAHIRAFWAAPMRKEIVRCLMRGGEGLTPVARAAVAQLAASARPDRSGS